MAAPEPIKFWRLSHEEVVFLHLLKRSNTEIANLSGYTPERVSQILHDPEALRLIESARLGFREKMFEQMGDRLARLADASLDNIESTVMAPFVPGTRAKEHQDKLGLELLAIVGYSKKGQISEAQKPRELGPTFTPEGEDRLLRALEKANNVRELHPEIEEAEWTEESA